MSFTLTSKFSLLTSGCWFFQQPARGMLHPRARCASNSSGVVMDRPPCAAAKVQGAPRKAKRLCEAVEFDVYNASELNHEDDTPRRAPSGLSASVPGGPVSEHGSGSSHCVPTFRSDW